MNKDWKKNGKSWGIMMLINIDDEGKMGLFVFVKEVAKNPIFIVRIKI